jgi:hypothetical protein
LLVVVVTHVSSTCCASRYFAWGPNDYSVDYSIAATVNGQALGAPAIERRYRFAEVGFYEDPPERLERYLRRRDEIYAAGDHIRLVLRYRLDGHRTVVWRWAHG